MQRLPREEGIKFGRGIFNLRDMRNKTLTCASAFGQHVKCVAKPREPVGSSSDLDDLLWEGNRRNLIISQSAAQGLLSPFAHWVAASATELARFLLGKVEEACGRILCYGPEKAPKACGVALGQQDTEGVRVAFKHAVHMVLVHAVICLLGGSLGKAQGLVEFVGYL